MTVRFLAPEEDSRPLPISIGLCGASGTGKTRSALEIARGIAREVAGAKSARIGFVDTENRRGLHFREMFPEMAHFDMRAADGGFGADRWFPILDKAEESGIPVLVIDSFSHVWEGADGVLERQARALQRLTGGNAAREGAMNQLSWAQPEVKPVYRRLMNRLIAAQLHVILCTRAKAVVTKKVGGQVVNDKPNKFRRNDVHWDAATDKELIFELTAQIVLEPGQPGVPVHHIKMPDQLAALFPQDRPMTAETGRQLALWSKGAGDAARNRRIVEGARNAAHQGREALQAFWRSLPLEERQILRDSGDTFANCQRIVLEGEARQSLLGDDPMAGADPLPEPQEGAAGEEGDGPTQEELERAMREAGEEADRQAAEAQRQEGRR